jgi:hypothetical protein
MSARKHLEEIPNSSGIYQIRCNQNGKISGLCVVHMHELKSGKRPSHKGWTWRHDADQAFE